MSSPPSKLEEELGESTNCHDLLDLEEVSASMAVMLVPADSARGGGLGTRSDPLLNVGRGPHWLCPFLFTPLRSTSLPLKEGVVPQLVVQKYPSSSTIVTSVAI